MHDLFAKRKPLIVKYKPFFVQLTVHAKSMQMTNSHHSHRKTCGQYE